MDTMSRSPVSVARPGAGLRPLWRSAASVGLRSESSSTLRVSEPGSFELCAQPVHEEEALDEIRAVSSLLKEATRRIGRCGLLLTGSFARGEGTIVRDGAGCVCWLS